MAPQHRDPRSNTLETSTSHDSLSIDPALQLTDGASAIPRSNHQPLDSNTAPSAPESDTLDITSSTQDNQTHQIECDDLHDKPDSRRQSVSSMRNSASYEGPPSVTPTGRVSKAKKGKRVHACEFPGCGKVFSRAEHRRRHELNHNPEALFRCTRPGCRKSFHRSDLLQRHYERHELENTAEHGHTHLRANSSTSIASTPHSMPESSGLLPMPMNSPSLSQSVHRSASDGVSIPDIVHPNNYALINDALSFSPYVAPAVPYMSSYPSPDNSSFYTPRSSRSPAPELYPHYHRPRGSSTSSTTGLEPSIASPMLSAELASSWISGPPGVMSGNVYDDTFETYVPFATGSSVPISLSNLDELEWSALNRELSNVPGIQPGDVPNGLSGVIRWYCLEYYWQYFNPYFPIVHRPTFLPTKPSPLLLSAMIAIGSSFDKREDSQLYTLTLLEVATKLLRKRNTVPRVPRLADMQTVLLLEVLTTYRSRHIDVEPSSRFRSLCTTLLHSLPNLNANPSLKIRDLPPHQTVVDLHSARKTWVEHETSRRVLQASVVLDTQRRTLFEQQSVFINRNMPLLNIQTSLSTMSLPSTDRLWSTSPVEEWAELARSYHYADATLSSGGCYGSEIISQDFFQAQVQIAIERLGGERIRMNRGEMVRRDDPAKSTESKFNRHALELARLSPVRSLLIVSGEGWLHGQKLENEAEVDAAKRGLRDWVRQPEYRISSCSALWHALQLFQMSIVMTPDDVHHKPDMNVVSFKDTHMLHEQWCFFLAALVCWACGCVGCTDVDDLSMTTATTTRTNPHVPCTSTSETLTQTQTQAQARGRFGHHPKIARSVAQSPMAPPPLPSPSRRSPTQINNRAHPDARTQSHDHHHRQYPPLMSALDASRGVQTYLQATTRDEITGPDDIPKIDPRALAQFHGLLEVVRSQKIVPAMGGGLMHHADKVLYRLVQGTSPAIRFW